MHWRSSVTASELSPSNCLHEIQSLTIFYLPPYKRLVWHYQQANTDHIKQPIELIFWQKSISNIDVNKQVSAFNETIMKVFENFIPHETITCNNKDPPCMNKQIKTLIVEEKHFI